MEPPPPVPSWYFSTYPYNTDAFQFLLLLVQLRIFCKSLYDLLASYQVCKAWRRGGKVGAWTLAVSFLRPPVATKFNVFSKVGLNFPAMAQYVLI